MSELVNWSELMIMDAEIASGDEDIIMEVLAHIGMADVKQFGLYWDDCEKMMQKLGYRFQVKAIKAA